MGGDDLEAGFWIHLGGLWIVDGEKGEKRASSFMFAVGRDETEDAE